MADTLACFNGLGGFNSRHEYEIRLSGDELPPAPWLNVIANPNGGFLASETGAGPTWAVNSSFFRLTSWENDPVSDSPGDCIYLRDDESGNIWTATAAPIRETNAYTTRHGAGYTVYEHEHDAIVTSLRVGVPEEDAVKIQVLSITNTGNRPRKISIITYVEWILGADRERTRGHVNVEALESRSTILAVNNFEEELADQVAFSAMSEPLASLTTDRTAFLGRNGSPVSPAMLGQKSLDGIHAGVADPCAAMHAMIALEPGETCKITVLLGSASGRSTAVELAERYRSPDAADAGIDKSVIAWRKRLDTIQVKTPEQTFDVMMNQWSLYQALSCRMWGRIALYQSSGAYGFRDQLQDSMAFVYAEPSLARTHIIHAASRQFEEGDVQHWWHPHSGRGVRTRFADDLIWLPFVVNHYVSVSGDRSVLDEPAGYVKLRLLDEGEDEIYDVPDLSPRVEAVYDHCVRALRRACTSGAHGLPLINGGDWNDGMNRVGVEGKGESVWLAWFLCRTLRDFAEHAKARGDDAFAGEILGWADKYEAAVESTSWDGEWYRRAYYDDGAPLGSHANLECRIDAIAQSWSVISGAGNAERARRGMKSFNDHLVREDARLLMLLTPSFDKDVHDPGYIQGYLPGVRENGAQYTHAAIWSVLATAMLGDGNRAFELYQMINPVTHALTPEDVSIYKVEPYVVAADVYTAEGHLGRGGWTWYTGSASWLYRVGLEAILGFRKEGSVLRIDPCIPSAWKEFSIEYRYGSSEYLITVRNPDGVQRGIRLVTVDGVTSEGGAIELVDDGGKRVVEAWLGS